MAVPADRIAEHAHTHNLSDAQPGRLGQGFLPRIRAAAQEQLAEGAFNASYRRGLDLPYDEALSFAQASAAAESERCGSDNDAWRCPPGAVGLCGTIGACRSRPSGAWSAGYTPVTGISSTGAAWA
jgi:hypothetical protein